MKRLLIAFALLALPATAFAQGNHIYTSGTTPTSCRIGDIFIKTITDANPQQYLCTATNVWTPVPLSFNYVTKTGNYTATALDGTIELITNAGTITLPTADGISGRVYRLKNLQTANALTIATTSSQTVDGAAPGTITNGCLDLQSDGANWRIIGSCGLPLASLTSGGVIYASSTTSVASSALLAANALVVGGGAGTAPATITTGTGVVTALGVNVGSTGAFVVQNGALGTPSSGTLTLPFHMYFTAAVIQNATASGGYSTPTTLGAVATGVGTTAASGDPAYATATFAAGGADTELHGHFKLPSDWTGAIDLSLTWNSLSAASGDVVWQVQFGCTATGEVPTSISFNNSVFTAVANQTSPTAAFNVASKTSITTTGCAAGETAFFIIHRDTDTSGDTLDQAVELIEIDFTYRRAVVIGGL